MTVRRPSTRDADRGRRRPRGLARASRAGAAVAKRATIPGGYPRRPPALAPRGSGGRPLGSRGTHRDDRAGGSFSRGAAGSEKLEIRVEGPGPRARERGRLRRRGRALLRSHRRVAPASGPAFASHAPGSTQVGRGNLRLKKHVRVGRQPKERGAS